jgi:hypothetical protein
LGNWVNFVLRVTRKKGQKEKGEKMGKEGNNNYEVK